MLCNQGPINIGGGQSARTLDRASFEAISDFSRGSCSLSLHAFCSFFIPSRCHALTSSSSFSFRGVHTCPATYEMSNYAKCEPINDGYARCESRRWLCLYSTDRHFLSLQFVPSQMLLQILTMIKYRNPFSLKYYIL